MDDEELNEEQENQAGDMNATQGSQLTREMGNNVGRYVSKRLQEQAKSKAAKHSLLKFLSPIALKLGLIAAIIILVLSIAMFIISMPGMSMEKLKELFDKFGNTINSFFGGDTTAMVSETEINEVLNYLETMGFAEDGGLKGAGFLTKFYDVSPSGSTGYVIENDVQGDGVVRDADDKIIKAESDYIKIYIMSNNYMYTVKNRNIVSNSFIDWLNSLGKSNAERVQEFGKGMLNFYYELAETTTVKDENGKDTKRIKGVIGRRDDPVNLSFFSDTKIKVDSEKKTIRIEDSNIFDPNNPMEFSIDGWTGRYGMPLEFLLSIHQATYMPDLAVDMFTSFPTSVNIYLHKVTGNADVYYQTPDGNKVTYVELDKVLWADNARKTYNGNGPFPSGKDATELGLPVGEEYNDGCKCNTPDCYNVSGRCHFLCEICRKRLEDIRDILEAYSDKSNPSQDKNNYKTYQPYIASVTNHWYRDVYFVLDSQEHRSPEGVENSINWTDDLNFIDYDYEYEAMYKERWTLYETWDDDADHPELAGYIKLYDLDENGELASDPITDLKIYEAGGVIKDSEGKVIKRYAKKAVTMKAGDDDAISYDTLFGGTASNHPLSDLGWVYDSKHKIWSAYEEGDVSDTFGGQPPQKLEIPDGYDCNEEDKDRFWLLLKLKEGVVQVGEGQRAETNPTIKNIFLNNKYFKYDGSKERAEIIAKLREKVRPSGQDTYYTAVKDEDMEKFVTFDASGEGDTEYKVWQFVDSPDINQDSLNAFSMLENTHTLDADFIYRDFKELIVELGYFTRSDLTDETPRLLQWLVPEIGSYGFPKRSIDKNENEKLTMIHSEGDIDVKVKEMTEASGEDNFAPEGTGSRGANLVLPNNNIFGLTNAKKKRILTSFNDGPISDISNTIGEVSEFKKATFLETAKACWEYVVDAGRYSYAGGAQIPITNGNIVDCSSFVSWCIYEHGYEDFEGAQHDTVSFKNTNWNEAYGWEEIEVGAGEDCSDKLQPGDILVRDNGGGPNGHVQIIASIEGDDIIVYDCGDSSNWASSNRDGMSYPSFAKSKEWPGKIIRIDAVNQIAGDLYKGYKGNESVVSPVTGLLIEYGTYGPDGEDDDMDNITGEKYRTNIDYKYSETGEEKDAKAPVDRVGYAKILVLDKQIYSNLEKQFIDNNQISGMKDIDGKSYDSFVDAATGKYKEMKITEDLVNGEGDYDGDGWSIEQKNIYGYKEFAEAYEKYGIAGHIIYIDGFVCEYPEKREEGEDEDGEDFTPSGTPITLDTFKEIEYGDLASLEDSDDSDDSDEDEIVKTLYEKDPEYNVASKTVRNRMNAEAMLKDEAVPTFYTGDKITLKLENDGGTVSYDGILLKEGTVIGRTITDKELIMGDNFRESKYGSYQSLRGDGTPGARTAWMPETEEADPKIIGNYLTIRMFDNNNDPIENVEDYMKLDDGKGNSINNTDLDKITNDSPVEDKIKALMGYLISQGFSEESAAGVLGNLLQEAGGTLNALSDNGTHFGLCQWSYSGSPEEPTDGRWKTVLDWAKSQGYTYDSFAGQGRGICESPDAEAYAEIISRTKSASTLAEATEIWCKEYEVCGDYDVEVPRRTRKAEAALRVYKGEDSTYTE